MARWRYSFIYIGSRDKAVMFGHTFPRGEVVTIALDKLNHGVLRQANRAGLEYLGLVDILEQQAPKAEPGTGAETTVFAPEPEETKPPVIRRRGRGRGTY